MEEIEITSLKDLKNELNRIPDDYSVRVALGSDCSGTVNYLSIHHNQKKCVIWGNYH